MEPYRRSYPEFSLCGLNCGLCPRYHTNGSSRCCGCGGEHFNELHPSCTIIRCSKTKGSIEYCHECPEYPCERYTTDEGYDSFIAYRNRLVDQQRTQEFGMQSYREVLDAKIALLRHLLTCYDDGRHKGFYCLAVNLLPLSEIQAIVREVEAASKGTAHLIVDTIKDRAEQLGISLRLRVKRSV